MRWLQLFVFGTIGAALLVQGAIQGRERYPIFRDNVPTRGTLVELHEEKSGESSVITYFPVVEFSTRSTARMRFRSDAGSEGAPEYEVGTEVDVLYDPRDPMHARIGSFTQLWAVPLATGCIGLTIVLLSCLLFVKIGRFEKGLRSVGSGGKGNAE